MQTQLHRNNRVDVVVVSGKNKKKMTMPFHNNDYAETMHSVMLVSVHVRVRHTHMVLYSRCTFFNEF